VVDVVLESIFKKAKLSMIDGSPKYFLDPIHFVTPRKDDMLCLILGEVLELKKIYGFWKLIICLEAYP